MATKTVTPIALFFYVGTLTQDEATKVEAYFARGGYRTYFRRDVAGQKDIVEKHVKIVGGGQIIPQRYIAAYQDDPTRILDSRTLAEILADNTLVPPTVTPPSGFAAMMLSAPVEDGFGTETTADTETTTNTEPAPAPAPPPAP